MLSYFRGWPLYREAIVKMLHCTYILYMCICTESANAIKSRRHKVAYSYAAENADELTLQPGEVCQNA